MKLHELAGHGYRFDILEMETLQLGEIKPKRIAVFAPGGRLITNDAKSMDEAESLATTDYQQRGSAPTGKTLISE